MAKHDCCCSIAESCNDCAAHDCLDNTVSKLASIVEESLNLRDLQVEAYTFDDRVELARLVERHFGTSTKTYYAASMFEDCATLEDIARVIEHAV
jgi:hypothetical protein